MGGVERLCEMESHWLIPIVSFAVVFVVVPLVAVIANFIADLLD